MQAGGHGEFIPLDLTRGASIDAFVDAAVAKIGGAPDIIANVAGLDRVMPFVENTPDVWELLAQVNYIGPVRMIHRFLPLMLERRSGKIVTVASDAGRVGSMGETFYAGTKGAIIAFTKSLARETARAGLTCNCVAPGPTDTPLFNGTIPEGKLRDALIKADPAEAAGAAGRDRPHHRLPGHAGHRLHDRPGRFGQRWPDDARMRAHARDEPREGVLRAPGRRAAS